MIFSRYTNRRFYEVNDHLGNVCAVVGDAKDWHTSIPNEFMARVSNISNYYPFGMAQPGRMYSTGDYKYGYNGNEEDNEVKGGDGKSLDYGARWYDPRPRKARWDANDAYEGKHPSSSPYGFAANSPISVSDFAGHDVFIVSDNIAFMTVRHLASKLLGSSDVLSLFQKGGEQSSKNDIYLAVVSSYWFKEAYKHDDFVRTTWDDLFGTPESYYPTRYC